MRNVDDARAQAVDMSRSSAKVLDRPSDALYVTPICRNRPEGEAGHGSSSSRMILEEGSG
jgi:hypothetical protein